jgi:RNA polymerase sigma factor (TIGR02999 family)
MEHVTDLLAAWGRGDASADDRLMAAVYTDLRGVARRRLRSERDDHSLVPTALVHEAYLRLVALRRIRWQNRAHFFAIAARIMRRVLVDHARGRAAAKRDSAGWTVTLSNRVGTIAPRNVDLLDLDTALERLAMINQRLADLIVLRYFGGLTVEETAQEMSLSPATVKRDWAHARAWMYRELRGIRNR